MSKKISICIPAYNRSIYLAELLDSALEQMREVDEIIICEDLSPEREAIINIVKKYKTELSNKKIKLVLNEVNLGYDRNFKKLLNEASGDYCLFMGNDDILLPGSIEEIANVIDKYDVGVITRSYLFFQNEVSNIKDTIRYLPDNKFFEPGIDTIRFFFRRVGVLSGLVFNRELAMQFETDEFDGHLYYQMYLAGSILVSHSGYYIANTLTASRDGITPDFGNSDIEKNKFKPGSYKYFSRIYMVEGLLKIANKLNTELPNVSLVIKKDISIYFYPYIRDQLNLGIMDYLKMVQGFRKVGMGGLFFYLHCFLGYILKQKRYDSIIKVIRAKLGYTPRIGF